MNERALKSLHDIVNAGDELVSFTNEVTLETFLENIVLQRATERNFEIIGEALGRIRHLETDTLEHITSAHQIIGFRNVLIHGYDVIDPVMVWQAATLHLPGLLKEVHALLNTQN